MEIMDTTAGGQPLRGQAAAHSIVESRGFKSLVAKRWGLTLVLLALLFASYYGFILLVAWNKSFMASRIGQVTTLGIPIGVGVIVIAWILTAIYVVWTNRSYDPEVERLKGQLRK